MNIKKWNARLSLFTMALLLIHELYQLYAYISFYYNPVLSKAFGYAVASGFVLHGILSAVCIFALHDAKTVAYKKLNFKTVLQRVSSVIIVLLLPLHIFSFALLQGSVGSIAYIIVETVQVVFYISLSCHVGISFSNALVTLGRLEDIGKKACHRQNRTHFLGDAGADDEHCHHDDTRENLSTISIVEG